MPINQKDNLKYCINHKNELLHRSDGYNALTKLTREGPKTLFFPTVGVPIVIYSCPKCGYIELYLAERDTEWINLDRYYSNET